MSQTDKSIIEDQKKRSCILELRQLMSKDEKLCVLQCEDIYIARFLNSTSYIVADAFQKMKLFYDLLEECPDWYASCGPLEKKNVIEKDIRIVTGQYDKEGRPILIAKLRNHDPGTMDLVKDVVTVDDHCVEMLLLNNPSHLSQKGICIIVDISSLSFRLMKWLTPQNIRTSVRRMETVPIKEYRFHVVNSSLFVQIAIKIIWPFFSQSMKEAYKFHFNDWSSLYKYIDQEVLPKEYGGQQSNDYRRCHLQLYNKNSEILDSYKVNREVYLKSVRQDK